MACIAILSPAASTATTTGISSSKPQIGSAFDPSAYGSFIVAVQLSMTPSSTSFTPTTLSQGDDTDDDNSIARSTCRMMSSADASRAINQCAATRTGSDP